MAKKKDTGAPSRPKGATLVDWLRSEGKFECHHKLSRMLSMRFTKRGRPEYLSEITKKVNVVAVAKAMGLSNECVYIWLRRDRITLRGANLFIKKFPDVFRMKDFLPFFSDGDYESLPDEVAEVSDLV